MTALRTTALFAMSGRLKAGTFNIGATSDVVVPGKIRLQQALVNRFADGAAIATGSATGTSRPLQVLFLQEVPGVLSAITSRLEELGYGHARFHTKKGWMSHCGGQSIFYREQDCALVASGCECVWPDGNTTKKTKRVLGWALLYFHEFGQCVLACNNHTLSGKNESKCTKKMRMQHFERCIAIVNRLATEHNASNILFGGDFNVASNDFEVSPLRDLKSVQSQWVKDAIFHSSSLYCDACHVSEKSLDNQHAAIVAEFTVVQMYDDNVLLAFCGDRRWWHCRVRDSQKVDVGVIPVRFPCDDSIGCWPSSLVVSTGSRVTEKGGSDRGGRVVGACGCDLLIEGPEGLWRCSHTDLNIPPCIESLIAFSEGRWWLCSVQGVLECGVIPIRFYCDGSIGRWPSNLVVRLGGWVADMGRIIGSRGGDLLLEGPQGSWRCSVDELNESNAALRFETWRGASLVP